MIDMIVDAFSFAFMIRAFVVGIAVAISGSFLGSFLVLRRYAMIGHGLAHISFGAVAIALFLGQTPLLVTLPIVVLASLLILYLSENSNIGGDTAIGLLSSFAIALATFLSSLRGGFGTDLNSYLFGSILFLTNVDVILSVVVAVLVILMVYVFYDELFASTFDEMYARVNRVNIKTINRLLAILTAVTVTIGIQSIGVLLISSMIIFPTIIALQFRQGFQGTILLAVGVSVVVVFLGILSSYVLNLPTGSTIVMLSATTLVVAYWGNRLRKGVDA
jgi:zinc transport system permease protein